MDVELRSGGFAETAGGCLSFGLLTMMMKKQRNQLPLRLDDNVMLLRDGRTLPWAGFQRVKKTDVYLNGKFVRSTWDLSHTAGKFTIPSDKIEQPDAVMDFILRRLPPQAIERQP